MHVVQIIDDDALPTGHDFLLTAVPDGAIVFLRRSALNSETLEDVWAAYRALLATPQPMATRPSELSRTG